MKKGAKLLALTLFAMVFLARSDNENHFSTRQWMGTDRFRPPGDHSVPPVQTWDDFKGGFSLQKWFHFSAGNYIGDDGIPTTSSQGLKVVPTGKNRRTGQPAFVRTIEQEDEQTAKNGYALPSGLDHVKWLVFMNHQSSTGYPGFDAKEGYELSFETTISGESFGVKNHPFGNAVKDAQDDLRLGAVAFNSIDFETYMVFDFFLTNERIYAFYERLPFGRDVLGNYASFSYQIPVANRNPDDFHKLKISYDKSKGTVTWSINNKEVFQVDKIGYRIDRKYMTLDHGGVETLVSPNQLDGGMGMFTLLDGSNPNGKGLVRLSSVEGTYYNPANGSPRHSFIDDQSEEDSRLFGQGAELRMKNIKIINKKSNRH